MIHEPPPRFVISVIGTPIDSDSNSIDRGVQKPPLASSHPCSCPELESIERTSTAVDGVSDLGHGHELTPTGNRCVLPIARGEFGQLGDRE